MPHNEKTSPKGLTTKHIILILGSLLIICAAVITAILLLRQQPEATTMDIAGAKVVDKNNISEIEEEIKDKVASGMFETHMNTTWNFPDGKSPSSNAVMGNSAANNYPFWFTVSLADTQEVVYTSSLLPLGSQIEEIKLDKDLDEGIYEALITIHLVDDEGAEVESNMGFNITLKIEG
jgi:hypothetical protein